MIKFLVAAVWIVGVVIGTVFYSFQVSSAKPAVVVEPAAQLLSGLDYVKTDIISVPVVKDAAIAGYLLARLVYTIETETKMKLSVPIESLIIDEVYTYMFGNPQIDFSIPQGVDLDAFRNGIRDRINKRADGTLVHEVLIEQVDYMTKDEIRDNAVRRRSVDMKTPTFSADKPAKAEKPAAHH